MKNNRIFAFSMFLLLVLIFIIIYYFFIVKNERNFASLLPLDGKVAAYGEMMKNGQTIALEEIKTGNNNNFTSDISYMNTSQKKDQALDKLKEADKKGIKFISEIFGSEQLDHCLPYAIEKNMFIISGVDTRPDLVEKGKGNFYRIMPSDANACDSIMKWANEIGVKKAGILFTRNDDWSDGLLKITLKNCNKFNIEITEKREIVSEQTSYSATVSQLKSSDIEALFLFVYPSDGGRFLKEAQRQNLTLKYFATETFEGSTMIESAKDACIGVMMIIPATSEASTDLKRFKEKYKEKYGSEPTTFAIKGYDAFNLIFDIAKTSNFDVNRAKEIIKNYQMEGISGTIKFDKNGEFIPGNYDRKVFTKKGEIITSEIVVK